MQNDTKSHKKFTLTVNCKPKTANRTPNTEHRVKLKIADTVIVLNSRFKMEPLKEEYGWRYRHFIYKGKKMPEITLYIKLREKVPLLYASSRIFSVNHPLSGDTNWSLFKKDNKYVIEQYISQKKQCAVLNKDFNQGFIHLHFDKDDTTWKLEDIIYDLLQIILINYLSKKEGIFVHSTGLKDTNKKGLLFVGPTQAGKSTTARLWYNHSKAEVLNDDRMIIRKVNSQFFIFGSPWHGDFSDYLASRQGKAKLKRLFFIHHARNHKIKALNPKEAYHNFYPNIFPTFWNKDSLEKQTKLCQDIVTNIPCYRLGFRKDSSVIEFVRKESSVNGKRISLISH